MTGNKNKTTKTKRKGGFTLLEMLFATGIFVLVITLVVTVYVTAIGNQRRAFGLQSVLDNSRFALESMARSIRQSNITGVTQTTLDLDHPNKGSIQYSLSNGRIYENASFITAVDAEVEDLKFIASGVGNGDGLQPRITIVLKIIPGSLNFSQKAGEQSFINIQTTVTPRNLELP